MIGLAWHAEATCASVGGNEWLPEPGTRINPAVLAICATCPVREHCLRSALVHGDHFGVWAGMTWRQLSTLRARILAGEPPSQVIADGLTAAAQLVPGPMWAPGMSQLRDDYTGTAIVAARIKALPPPAPALVPALDSLPPRRVDGRGLVVCAHCGRVFQPSRTRGRLPRYCSPDHAEKSRQQRRARRRAAARQTQQQGQAA